MLKPLYARVVLRRDTLKSKTGLMVPQQYAKRNAPSRGVVIAKGPTASDEVEVGKTYLFGMHAGVWVNEQGIAAPDESTAQLYLCSDEDLLCEVG